jgi:survival-of-motor-neuron-related-splicing factor 30
MMQVADELSIEELKLNLRTYREQLQQVTELLAEDPSNSEYAEMEKELREVIELTEELLATAKQAESAGAGAKTDPSVSSPKQQSQSRVSPKQSLDEPMDEGYRFPIGSKVQAVWSDDGEWYDATVVNVTSNGYFLAYDEWGNEEEVDFDNVRGKQEGAVNALLEAEKQAEATKQAIKRKIAQAADAHVQSRDLPAKLRINPEDPEDVKAAKKKKIHAFKSKLRLEQLEVTQNKRQNAWQQFQTTKGKTKKVGFFSGRKKESIFKSPDDPKGKVGVTGSGKGITEFQKREKHLHLREGLEEGED